MFNVNLYLKETMKSSIVDTCELESLVTKLAQTFGADEDLSRGPS